MWCVKLCLCVFTRIHTQICISRFASDPREWQWGRAPVHPRRRAHALPWAAPRAGHIWPGTRSLGCRQCKLPERWGTTEGECMEVIGCTQGRRPDLGNCFVMTSYACKNSEPNPHGITGMLPPFPHRRLLFPETRAHAPSLPSRAEVAWPSVLFSLGTWLRSSAPIVMPMPIFLAMHSPPSE